MSDILNVKKEKDLDGNGKADGGVSIRVTKKWKVHVDFWLDLRVFVPVAILATIGIAWQMGYLGL